LSQSKHLRFSIYRIPETGHADGKLLIGRINFLGNTGQNAVIDAEGTINLASPLLKTETKYSPELAIMFPERFSVLQASQTVQENMQFSWGSLQAGESAVFLKRIQVFLLKITLNFHFLYESRTDSGKQYY
jgi:hypothetical protein